MTKRSFKDYALISLKGVGMGAADVVPGVSGGTIAFISGIYEELIDSLKSINLKAFRQLFKEGIGAFWRSINGTFLLALFAGIAVSVISLAKLMKWLLDTHPEMVWGFFFGLIVASAVFVARKIEKWNAGSVISLLVGIVVAYLITEFTPAETPNGYWFIFLAGSVAICAMILPGISGAFILLLLSKYKFMVDAIGSLKFDIIFVFLAGAAIGLLLFSNVLSWLLKKFHNYTIAVLSGFMIGSLNKVWPWKETTGWRIDSHGEQVPLLQDNVLPHTYEQVSGTPSHLLYVVLLALLGIAIIFFFEKFFSGESPKKTQDTQTV